MEEDNLWAVRFFGVLLFAVNFVTTSLALGRPLITKCVKWTLAGSVESFVSDKRPDMRTGEDSVFIKIPDVEMPPSTDEASLEEQEVVYERGDKIERLQQQKKRKRAKNERRERRKQTGVKVDEGRDVKTRDKRKRDKKKEKEKDQRREWRERRERTERVGKKKKKNRVRFVDLVDDTHFGV